MRLNRSIAAFLLLSASCGRVTGAGSEALQRLPLASGEDFTCAIVDDGSVACWGDRAYVGAGFTRGDAPIGVSPPVAVALPDDLEFVQVSASAAGHGTFPNHACALASDGTAWCWGDNSQGQLGDGGDAGGALPVAARMPDGVSFSQISTGAEHTCAVAFTGAVWCWGSGDHGQLGDDRNWFEDPYEAQGANPPLQVPLPEGVSIVRVAAGGVHTCALAMDGRVWCWGDDGSVSPPTGPVSVPTPPERELTDLVAGTEHTCALAADGTAWCWQLPSARSDAIVFAVQEPQQVPLPTGLTFARLASGSFHTCGVSSEQAIWCWGWAGGFGSAWYYGDVPAPSEPAIMPVNLSDPSGERFTDVAAGSGHTCGLSVSRTVWCWGDNEYGQLGDGTRDASLEPVRTALDLAAPAPVAESPQVPKVEAVDLEPYAGDAFLSPPPIWEVEMGETRRIWGAFSGLGEWQIPEYWGFPRKCTGSGRADAEQCELAYLSSLGADDRALSLLRDHLLTVSRVVGTTPVWIAESYDWSTFGTNYDGATPNLIFTRDGIIDLSSSNGREGPDLSGAFADALRSDLDERIAAAEANAWGPEYGYVFLGSYPEDFHVPFVAPARTPDGWAIPFSVRSGSGFHCCSYQFSARFVLELDGAGAVTGTRFVDWCYDPAETFSRYGEELPDEAVQRIADIGESLPECSW